MDMTSAFHRQNQLVFNNKIIAPYETQTTKMVRQMQVTLTKSQPDWKATGILNGMFYTQLSSQNKNIAPLMITV